MSHDHAHPLSPNSARQRPPTRRRLPMPAYQPPPKIFRIPAAYACAGPGVAAARNSVASLPTATSGRDCSPCARPGCRSSRFCGPHAISWRRSMLDSSVRSRWTSEARRGVRGPTCIRSSCATASGLHAACSRRSARRRSHWCAAPERQRVRDRAQRDEAQRARLRDHRPQSEEYGEWYYWLSIFGTPSATEPWGWQLDGHHLIINCFVLGDQIVLTPKFMGSEPVVAECGKYAGTRVFRAEESDGLALMRGTDAEQQRQGDHRRRACRASCSPLLQRQRRACPTKASATAISRPSSKGVLATSSASTSAACGPGHAEIRLEEAAITWARRTLPGSARCDDHGPFYYRIYSPVVLIEFDHQPGIVYATTSPRATTSTRWCARRTATTTARTCCASIMPGTIISTRAARTASAKSNVIYRILAVRAGRTNPRCARDRMQG